MNAGKIRNRCLALLAAFLMTAALAVTAWAATRYDTIEDLYWADDMTTARWDEIEDAYQYEIQLYRNDSRVTTVKTKKNYYNMEKKMTSEGEYTFKVRALAKSKSSEYSDGLWSSMSEGTYIDQSFAELMKNDGKIDTKNSGPGAAAASSESSKGNAVLLKEQWMQTPEGRWWYRLSDGSYPKDGWWQEPGSGTWYYFDAQGYMMTGWIDWNGKRYYCQPSGAMAVGEVTIDGVAYRFDGSGALQQ